jgi:hypothetical protein
MSTSALSTVTTKLPSAVSTVTTKLPSAVSTVTTRLPSAASNITAKLQSTPVKQASQPVATDSPGNWKHPKLAEITRRQRRTEFSERNIKTICFNGLALVISVMLRQLVASKLPTGLYVERNTQSKQGISSNRIHSVSADLKSYIAWSYLALQLVPVVNIVVAFLPLFRRQDDLADIALTPGQRKLLGLPPSSTPPTPNSAISTPPRYSRTPSLRCPATAAPPRIGDEAGRRTRHRRQALSSRRLLREASEGGGSHRLDLRASLVLARLRVCSVEMGPVHPVRWPGRDLVLGSTISGCMSGAGNDHRATHS